MVLRSWLMCCLSACCMALPSFMPAFESVEPAFPLQAGLRLTVATPLMGVDVIDDVEIDTAFTVEAMWHHLYPITDNGSVRLIGSPGLAIVYQEGSASGIDVDYLLPVLRFHLGIDVALGSHVHLECATFIGAGIGTLDIKLPNYREYEYGVVSEWGVTVAGIIRAGKMEIGGGLGWMVRRGFNRFAVDGTTLTDIKINQQYPKAFLALGWTF